MQCNPYAQVYTTVREEMARLPPEQLATLCLSFVTDQSKDPRRYNAPSNPEVAVVYEGDVPSMHRDVVVRYRTEERSAVQRVHPLSDHLDPLTYPLLFPDGQTGWHAQLEMGGQQGRVRTRVTAADFYCHRLMVRNEPVPPRRVRGKQPPRGRGPQEPLQGVLHRGGKLFQQFVVDVYCRIDWMRLQWFEKNQPQLRGEKLSGLMDYVARVDREGPQTVESVGKQIILPATHLGSPRDLRQRYLNALAIVRCFGKPDLFVTFTCSPAWPEIRQALGPHDTANDRPDLLARVFHLKLRQLLDDLLLRDVLGKVVAYTYAVEFQKRGLPHAHILLILRDRIVRAEQVDQVVSAELPDPETHPRLFEVVSRCMTHGPCGAVNPSARCMHLGACKYRYPRDFADATTLPAGSFAVYRRRDSGIRTSAGLDNRWVVPHNPSLLLRYGCHVNVEVCSSVRCVKYIYKYLHKGPDRAYLRVQAAQQGDVRNEVQTFLDARYVAAYEAAWRIFKFRLFDQSHTVLALPVHLPGESYVLFVPGREAQAVAAPKRTMLEAYFEANAARPPAERLRYTEFPTRYTWHPKHCEWRDRHQGHQRALARLAAVSASEGERYFLRCLLLHFPACSFEDLRRRLDAPPGGSEPPTYATFREAAEHKVGMGSDDELARETLRELAEVADERQLLRTFAVLVAFLDVRDPGALWAALEPWLCGRGEARLFRDDALRLLTSHLLAFGVQVDTLNLPRPSSGASPVNPAAAVREELARFPREAQEEVLAQHVRLLNDEQRGAYEAIAAAVDARRPALFFLDGPGGTGKSFLYETVLAHVRARGELALPVAWSGLAASVLPGGRTVHSRFKLPVPMPLEEDVASGLHAGSAAAEVLRAARVVVWDEAPNAPRTAFAAAERACRFVANSRNPDRLPAWGGKVVLLGGDFRQIPPVVPRLTGTPLRYTLRAWPGFAHATQLRLTQNMRARNDSAFATFVLQVGDGSLPGCEVAPDTRRVPLPAALEQAKDLEDLAAWVSADVTDPQQWEHRAVVTPTNDAAAEVNELFLKCLPGREWVFYSQDSILEDNPEAPDMYPDEFLHAQTPNGMPPHVLQLKQDAVLLLLRNVAPDLGLCNGTRVLLKGVLREALEVQVMRTGKRIFVPRVVMTSTQESGLPFQLRRRQFPVALGYCLTINKAQGQTFRERTGVYLPQPVFSHGQLYVALSRASSFAACRMLLMPEAEDHVGPPGEHAHHTLNVVCPALLAPGHGMQWSVAAALGSPRRHSDSLGVASSPRATRLWRCLSPCPLRAGASPLLGKGQEPLALASPPQSVPGHNPTGPVPGDTELDALERPPLDLEDAWECPRIRDEELTAQLPDAQLRVVLESERKAAVAAELQEDDREQEEPAAPPAELPANENTEDSSWRSAAAVLSEPPQQPAQPGEALGPADLPPPGRWRARYTPGGGNCLFHACRQASGLDMGHLDVRATIVAWATEHPRLEWQDMAFEGHMEEIGAEEGAIRDMEDRRYEAVMGAEGTYGGMFEAHVFGLAFHREVCVWSSATHEWTRVGVPGAPRVYLHHSAHPEHWEAVELLP